MHIKFLPHGSGDASRAAKYVMAEHDHLGIQRGHVELIQGDLEMFSMVANSLPFKNRYTSGVISWAETDKPTEEQMAAVLADMEKTMFAGLEPEDYIFCAIRHDDHIHVLSANCQLSSGLSFNPAPPGWEKTFDVVRDKHNYLHGWARPDDPARARLVQPGHEALIDAARIRAGQASAAIKPLIEQFIAQRVECGIIANRDDVITSLAELGEITRSGQDYISVRIEGRDKPTRLKGTFFNEQFNAADYRQNSPEDRNRPKRDNHGDRHRAQQCDQQLGEIQRRRAEKNSGRYGRVFRAGAEPAAKNEGDNRPDYPAVDITRAGNLIFMHLETGMDRNTGAARGLPDHQYPRLGFVQSKKRTKSPLPEDQLSHDTTRKDAVTAVGKIDERIRAADQRDREGAREYRAAVRAIVAICSDALRGCKAALGRAGQFIAGLTTQAEETVKTAPLHDPFRMQRR